MRVPGRWPFHTADADPTRRTLQVAVALAIAIAAALTLPAAGLARTAAHKTACRSATARTGRASRTCSTHATHTTRRRPSRHASRTSKRTAKRKRTTGTTRHAAAAVPARCEDGSAPVAGQEGTFTCADGSEPSCEDGSAPAPSGNGSKLVCPPAASGSGAGCEAGGECTFDTGGGWASSAEAACEDGSAPALDQEGSFACDDGSEPSCEDGSAPTPSSDGATLLCEAADDERGG